LKRNLLLVLGLCFLLHPLHSGEGNLLKNAALEASGANWAKDWIFWPSAPRVATVDGKKYLELEAVPGKKLYIFQRPVAIQGGHAYCLKTSVRGMEAEGNVELIIRFLKGNKSFSRSFPVPATEVTTIELPFLAPGEETDCEIGLVFAGKKGKVFFRDAKMTDSGKITGDFGTLKVSQDGNLLKFRTPDYLMELDTLRGFNPVKLEKEGKNTLGWSMLMLSSEKGKNALNDFYRNYYPEISAVFEDGEYEFTSKFSLDGWIEVQRKYTFYSGKSCIKINGEIKARKNFFCDRVTVNSCFPADFLTTQENGTAKTMKAEKSEWFSIPRNDKERFLFYHRISGPGIVVAGVDASAWKQLPDRILSSMSQEKRFTLELVFWANREIRNGDKLYYEYFLIPVSGGNAEEAGKIFRSLMGGN